MTPAPTPRVVIVDGVPMSGLLAEAAEPRATIVAVHGGATTSAYFDCPGHPRLSMLRLGQQLGFTVLALDRPGFGSSALFADEFVSTPKRIDAMYGAIDAIVDGHDRGAGVFLLGHSAGCELVLRMAADHHSDELLGIELAGTGLHQQEAALAVLANASLNGGPPVGLRELLWEPARLYPDGMSGAVRIRTGPVGVRYEAAAVSNWSRDLPELAARVRVPVRYTQAEYERVWEATPTAVAEVAAMFTTSPKVTVYEQGSAGHNLSLGHTAAAYHLSVLSFAEECVAARAATDIKMEAS